jgi:hypothetical protein
MSAANVSLSFAPAVMRLAFSPCASVPLRAFSVSLVFLVACADGGKGPDRTLPGVAAVADGDTLTVDSLSRLLAATPWEPSPARAMGIAQRWVDYRLLVTTAARGDSLKRPSLLDSIAAPLRDVLVTQRWMERQRPRVSMPDSLAVRRSYEDGIPVVARDLYVPVADTDTVQRRRVTAELTSLRETLTPENFVRRAAAFPRAAGATGPGGLLPIVALGDMPPVLDSAMRVLPVGGISGVVPTRAGLHMLYRLRWEDARKAAADFLVERAALASDSAIVGRVVQSAGLGMDSLAGTLLAEAVADLPGSLTDRRRVAVTAQGPLTVGDLAQLLHAYKPGQRQLLASAAARSPAEAQAVAEGLARARVLAKQAASASAPANEITASVGKDLALEVREAWRRVGVSPTILADSAPAGVARLQKGREWMDRAFGAMVADTAPDVDLSPNLQRALRFSGRGYVIPAAVLQVANADRGRASASPEAATSVKPSTKP